MSLPPAWLMTIVSIRLLFYTEKFDSSMSRFDCASSLFNHQSLQKEYLAFSAHAQQGSQFVCLLPIQAQLQCNYYIVHLWMQDKIP